MFGTDATSLVPRDSRHWKISVKKLLWPRLFRLADQVIVPSSAGIALMRSLGLPVDRVTLTPYVVDNDWWAAQASRVDPAAVRHSWGVAQDGLVVLFCAKLQSWRRPSDLLRAFAGANFPNALLVFAGEDPLHSQLETEAASLGISERVRFLGFMNQSQLPAVYASADLLVLPSEYEPFAVVVNEASCCGCPVAASDRVGAARDLILPANPDLIFPCGDIEALARILQQYLSDRDKLVIAARNARVLMDAWSPRENIAATVEAIRLAILRRRRAP